MIRPESEYWLASAERIRERISFWEWSARDGLRRAARHVADAKHAAELDLAHTRELRELLAKKENT